MQVQIIGQFVHELVFAGIITIVGAIAMWPIRKVKTAYKELQDAINSTHAELILQRTNCLQTLSNQGDKQVELLERMNGTLEAIHLDQARLSGRLDK
jgi:hypothetical protein